MYQAAVAAAKQDGNSSKLRRLDRGLKVCILASLVFVTFNAFLIQVNQILQDQTCGSVSTFLVAVWTVGLPYGVGWSVLRYITETAH